MRTLESTMSLIMATVWLRRERASWICPMKELWLTGYYQSLTTISKFRGFQTTAHISVFFGKTENSGIVHTLIVDQGTNYVRGPSLSHYLFMHIEFIERTRRNRYMQIKGGRWRWMVQ